MPSSTDDAGRAGAAPHGAGSRGYETRDANTKAVFVFLAFLFLTINLILFGTWRLFRHFSAVQQERPASSFSDERQIPPAPNLQVNGRADFRQMYAQQQQKLENYAWEDRQAGTVRVPIERAMELLLQKGLPVLPATAQAAASEASESRHGESVQAEEGR